MVYHANVIADYCGIIWHISNPITNMMPRTPPTMPPPPWRATKNMRPPTMFDRNRGFVKKLQMMSPAMMVETNETVIRVK